MSSMEKVWKQEMRCYIREWVDPSQSEEENYLTIIDKYEQTVEGVFIDTYNIDEEDIKQLGGSTKLVKRFEMYDDLSSEKQNEVWDEIEQLIKDYNQILMEEEEDWIRSKISKLLKTA